MIAPLTKREDEEDYVLENHDTVWITVNNVSVYIHMAQLGVEVALYELGRETDRPLARTGCEYPERGE